jgi:hypothetical protein
LLKKITKRDQEFAKKIKTLPEEWLYSDTFLFMKNRYYGEAELWKFIIYKVHRDAVRSLYYAHSNQHPGVGYRVKKSGSQIVLKTQILAKAYYFRYCVLLLQACGDKLSQLVKCALNINKWRFRGKNGTKERKASENNTTLKMLRRHLELNEQDPKTIFNAINDYLRSDNVRLILNLANEIKHRWTTLYQGEGLSPSRPSIDKIKNRLGKIIEESVPIGGVTIGVDIDSHIHCALVTNNLFVEMTEKIVKTLNFDKFYSFENGKKILVI